MKDKFDSVLHHLTLNPPAMRAELSEMEPSLCASSMHKVLSEMEPSLCVSSMHKVLNNENLLEHIVTPLTPYFICHHYIATEINLKYCKYIGVKLKLKANNLLENKNYHDIQHLDIIQVQVDVFDFFYDEVLPIIASKNIKVIIFTSQWHLPQIQKSKKTDALLNHPAIFLWISQNPIYCQHKKYMAFPYGLYHLDLQKYVDFVRTNDVNCDKNEKIQNLHSSVHPHLHGNHIRRKLDRLGLNNVKPMEYNDFLKNVLTAEFVISTSGDRDDCYRHYECIGLNTIPISNIGDGYKEIFGDNMIYSNEEEIIEILKNKVTDYTYKKPNRDILTVQYWNDKINERIAMLLESA